MMSVQQPSSVLCSVVGDIHTRSHNVHSHTLSRDLEAHCICASLHRPHPNNSAAPHFSLWNYLNSRATHYSTKTLEKTTKTSSILQKEG